MYVLQEVERKRPSKDMYPSFKNLFISVNSAASVSAETLGTTYVNLVMENRFPFEKNYAFMSEEKRHVCNCKYLFSFSNAFHSG